MIPSIHPRCCPTILPPPCPKCGLALAHVYDNFYGCPVCHILAIEYEGEFHFEGSFDYKLFMMWMCLDDGDDWPTRVGHVII